MKSPFARRLAITALAALSLGTSVRQAAADDAAVAERTALAVVRTVYRKASDHSVRRWIREAVATDQDDGRYGLKLANDWQAVAARAPELPLVVMIHGFNSTPARNAAILEPILAAGYPTAAFVYANDRDLIDSATRLSAALRDLAQAHPDRRVALVTHSMGGLVARACLEDPALDPGNVTRLVMIAPPSQGSMIAHAAFGADLWEHWINRADGGFGDRLRDSIVDGLGEAADDLVPGSPFLTRLNARPRNPKVRYAIFLGTHAAVSSTERDWLRWAVRNSASRVEGLRSFTGSIDDVMVDTDELVEGQGDGVVSVKRGRLAGVDDVVLLPFDHFSCTGKRDNEAVGQLQDAMLARLK